MTQRDSLHAAAERRLARVGQRHTRLRREILDLVAEAGRPVTVPELMSIDDADTSTAVEAERAFLGVLDGSCKTPIAGHAIIYGPTIQFRGLIAKPDGSAAHDIAGTGARSDAEKIGADAGRELKARGGPGFFD